MKVSIIIPVYNVSAYIERCIESVMNQTYKDIECIIVDDASPDDSIVKCEKMIAEYDGPIQFTILHHQQNRGLSAARNTGTNVAIGEFLYYLDSDDEITPDCIENLLKPMMEDNSIDFVQGNHMDEMDGKEFVFHKQSLSFYVTGDDARHEYYKSQNLYCLAWNKLIKRSFIINNKLFFKEGIVHEDVLWFFYVMKHLKKVFISNDVTYIYHRRSNSITIAPNKNFNGTNSQIITQDFLNHLTLGWEKFELRGCFYGFCETYCLYFNDVPELVDTFRLYRHQARRYGCWFVYFKLMILGTMRRFGNPLIIINQLHDLRCDFGKLFKMIRV